MAQIVRRPRFLEDLAESYEYLADRSPESATRFLAEVDVLVQLLAAFPEIGRRHEALRRDVRSFRVRRFRHLIFYRCARDGIVLLRVLHSARNVQPDMIGY